MTSIIKTLVILVIFTSFVNATSINMGISNVGNVQYFIYDPFNETIIFTSYTQHTVNVFSFKEKIIYTLAGTVNSVGNISHDFGILSKFNNPTSIALIAEKKGFLITDKSNNCIRYMNYTYPYNVLPAAGRCQSDGFGTLDGIGTVSRFRNPERIVTDNGKRFFISDTNNHCIRLAILNISLNVTRLVGICGSTGILNDNGYALIRYLKNPIAIVIIKEVLLIAESSTYRIIKVSPITILGNGGLFKTINYLSLSYPIHNFFFYKKYLIVTKYASDSLNNVFVSEIDTNYLSDTTINTTLFFKNIVCNSSNVAYSTHTMLLNNGSLLQSYYFSSESISLLLYQECKIFNKTLSETHSNKLSLFKTRTKSFSSTNTFRKETKSFSSTNTFRKETKSFSSTNTFREETKSFSSTNTFRKETKSFSSTASFYNSVYSQTHFDTFSKSVIHNSVSKSIVSSRTYFKLFSKSIVHSQTPSKSIVHSQTPSKSIVTLSLEKKNVSILIEKTIIVKKRQNNFNISLEKEITFNIGIILSSFSLNTGSITRSRTIKNMMKDVCKQDTNQKFDISDSPLQLNFPEEEQTKYMIGLFFGNIIFIILSIGLYTFVCFIINKEKSLIDSYYVIDFSIFIIETFTTPIFSYGFIIMQYKNTLIGLKLFIMCLTVVFFGILLTTYICILSISVSHFIYVENNNKNCIEKLFLEKGEWVFNNSLKYTMSITKIKEILFNIKKVFMNSYGKNYKFLKFDLFMIFALSIPDIFSNLVDDNISCTIYSSSLLIILSAYLIGLLKIRPLEPILYQIFIILSISIQILVCILKLFNENNDLLYILFLTSVYIPALVQIIIISYKKICYKKHVNDEEYIELSRYV